MEIDSQKSGYRTPRLVWTARQKEAVLAAARTLFMERGFESVSSTDIAHLAGVDEAVPARYFGGKLALFIRIVDEMADEVVGGLGDMRPPDRSPEQAVQAITLRLVVALGAPVSIRLHALFFAQPRQTHRCAVTLRRRLADAMVGPLRSAFECLPGGGDPAVAATEGAAFLYDFLVERPKAALRRGAQPTARELRYWSDAAAALLLVWRAETGSGSAWSMAGLGGRSASSRSRRRSALNKGDHPYADEVQGPGGASHSGRARIRPRGPRAVANVNTMTARVPNALMSRMTVSPRASSGARTSVAGQGSEVRTITSIQL